jgi:hypothetical protein
VSIDDSAGTSDFKLGDRVFGLAYGGAVSKAFIEEQEASNFCSQYSQMISVSEKMLMRIPANMAFETAAGIPEVGPEKFLGNGIDQIKIDIFYRHPSTSSCWEHREGPVCAYPRGRLRRWPSLDSGRETSWGIKDLGHSRHG